MINKKLSYKLKILIVNLLTDKKFLISLSVLIFIFTCIVVGKAFYLGDKVDHYEEFFFETDKKYSTETITYIQERELEKLNLNTAASNLVNCINTNIDINNLPDNIKNIINEINNFYNQSNNYFAFKYVDIHTGFTVSYNENQNIFTASTIKDPKDIYIYEMASQGKINLEEELTYTGKYYNTGTGVLKNTPFNRNYNIKTLVNYSTVHSDNAAHNMLMDRYGRQNMLEFWQNKGTTAIFTQNTNWGVLNAHDASIYMNELYRFYINDEKYGKELMANFLNATTKFLRSDNNYMIANKSGWSGSALHDVGIIFADNPYILIGLSNLGEGNYVTYFNKVNDFGDRLHTEYWKYKMELCNNITQY